MTRGALGVGAVGVGGAIVLIAGFAQAAPTATAAQKRAASEAFSACREQAKEGDATACWKTWVRKYKLVGGEAEVAYAEEHLAPPPAPTALSSTPTGGGGTVTLARATEMFDACREREADGDASACWKRWLGKYRDVGTRMQVVFAEAHADRPAAPAAAPSDSSSASKDGGGGASAEGGGAAVVPAATGDVFDFCALKPRQDSTRFVKQRVIVFAPADAAAVEQENAIRSVGGARLVREVFAARFPLDRFFNIVTTFGAKKEWATAPTISVDDVRSFVGAGNLPAGSDEKEEHDFVSYALGCSDYVAFPTLESQEAKWEEREVQTSDGKKRKVNVLVVKLTGALGVYHREGDTLRLVQTVRASVPSLVDLATDSVAGSVPDVKVDLKVGGLHAALGAAKSALKLPSYLSALPDAACKLAKAGVDGTAGLGACPKEGHASGVLAASTIEERASPICREAMNEKTPPGRAKTAMVICEVRARAAQLARALQKEARGVEGWKLFAPLQKGLDGDSDADAMSLGREEGMKVGYGFYALSPAKERLAYFKVTHLGPGGEPGITSPSGLNRRYGEAPEGARLEEYPLLGISVMPFGGIALLTQNYGTSTFAAPGGQVHYALPTMALGGGLRVSYDLSSLLGVVELYLRIGGGVYVASGALSVMLIPTEVQFEKGFYLGRVLTWYASLGGGPTFVNVDIPDAGNGSVAQQLSATLFGATLHTGLDFTLHPAVSLRVEGMARMNFGAASYQEKDGKPVANGWDHRADHYSMIGGNLALGWTF